MIKRDFPTFLLYALAFLLIWEWLRPVEQLTDTHIGSFIFFLLIAFLVSFFNLKWFWRFIIQAAYILFVINRFYYHVSFFHFSWLKLFLTDVQHNISLLLSRNWDHFSDAFRTLLFFILLWIMVYLIQYWLLRRQRIFIFFFMTLVYITVLDTFTTYSAKWAIVRTVVAGFTVMGMLTFYRILRKEHVTNGPSFLKKWMTLLAAMIALSVLIGIAAPKAAPIWPDPVPYFKGEGAGAGGNGNSIGSVKRIGYGTDDTQLGGPFIGNDNPVFFYHGDNKNYWKVETKDYYTGKGWMPSGSTSTEFRQGDLVPVYPVPPSVESVQTKTRVDPVDRVRSPVIYPAGIQKIHDIEPKVPENQLFSIDTTTEKIQSFYNTWYYVDFEIPEYKASDLRKTTKFDPKVIDPAFYQRYTQLPFRLPARIKQLTEKITAGDTNWFDKARDVERYFGNNEYTYDQKNVAVPSEKQDYVDQFLFETKRGYCDNFSSSMAVMLRTIGIPTRWVKGFTGGELLQSNQQETTQKVYKITNNNAHSWVEVFFPNQGWVPFEPTQGFSNDLIINYGNDSQTLSAKQPTTPAPQVKKLQKALPIDSGATGKTKSTIRAKTLKTYLQTNWKSLILTVILLGCLAGVLYWIRGKWMPYWIVVVYRFKKKDESVADAYHILLKQLSRYGLKRKESQTLRSYARYIDSFFSTREMTRFTTIYEQYMYHRQLPEGTWQETHKLWENLIKKTIA